MLLGVSLAFATQPPSDILILEDFENAPLGALPPGWKTRAFEGEPDAPYRIVEENGERFLRAEDRGENVMLYKEVRWDTADFPYFGWRWRVRRLPDGADSRYDATADSGAGVYLSYRRKLGLVPETIKFIWSERLTLGVSFRRPGMGQAWTVVAGSGPAESAWQRVVFHVNDAYRATFGGRGVDRPLGIAVLSDANNTSGAAFADYDDFVAMRELPPGVDVSRVGERLDVSN